MDMAASSWTAFWHSIGMALLWSSLQWFPFLSPKLICSLLDVHLPLDLQQSTMVWWSFALTTKLPECRNYGSSFSYNYHQVQQEVHNSHHKWWMIIIFMFLIVSKSNQVPSWKKRWQSQKAKQKRPSTHTSRQQINQIKLTLKTTWRLQNKLSTPGEEEQPTKRK